MVELEYLEIVVTTKDKRAFLPAMITELTKGLADTINARKIGDVIVHEFPKIAEDIPAGVTTHLTIGLSSIDVHSYPEHNKIFFTVSGSKQYRLSEKKIAVVEFFKQKLNCTVEVFTLKREHL